MKIKKADRIKVAVFHAGKGIELKTIANNTASFKDEINCQSLATGCIEADYETYPVIYSDDTKSEDNSFESLTSAFDYGIGYGMSYEPFRVLSGNFIVLQLKNIHLNKAENISVGELTSISDKDYKRLKNCVETVITQSKTRRRRMFYPALFCLASDEEETPFFELSK